MAPLVPLFVKLAGRDVVVVGGGAMAALRVRQLSEAGARVTVVAPLVRDDVAAGAAVVHRRAFRAADLDAAWLAVAAATPEVNREVAEAAEARRLLVNAVDDPETATAYTAGVVRRGDATVAISTGGRAPALAGLLREALDALLPRDVASWVDTAEAERDGWKRARVPLATRRPLLLEKLNALYARAPSPRELRAAAARPRLARRRRPRRSGPPHAARRGAARRGGRGALRRARGRGRAAPRAARPLLPRREAGRPPERLAARDRAAPRRRRAAGQARRPAEVRRSVRVRSRRRGGPGARRGGRAVRDRAGRLLRDLRAGARRDPGHAPRALRRLRGGRRPRRGHLRPHPRPARRGDDAHARRAHGRRRARPDRVAAPRARLGARDARRDRARRVDARRVRLERHARGPAPRGAARGSLEPPRHARHRRRRRPPAHLLARRRACP